MVQPRGLGDPVSEQAVHQLVDDLKWLGLNWDNADLVFQSKRQGIYNRIIDDLISRGLAYKAYETPEELDVRRKDAEKAKRALDKLSDVVERGENFFPTLIETVEVCSLGQITGRLQEIVGHFRPMV